MDKYLESGFIGLMVEHPLTHKLQESLLPIGNYSQDRPGIKKYLADVSEGELSKDAHGEATVQDVAKVVFAKLVGDKGEQYLLDAMAKSDKSLEAAAKEAKLETWRAQLDAPEFAESMSYAASLYADRESLKAQMAELDAKVAQAKAEAAKTLGIDPTFDLAHVSTGWYVAEDTPKATGKKQPPVSRDYSADVYTQDGKSINEVAVKSVAKVTKRSDDGKPSAWAVTYTAKGKSYSGEAKSLNKANQKARAACMAVIAPDAKTTACNAPEWFDVPVAK